MPFPVASNQWLDPVTTNVARLYRVVAVSPAERGKVLSVAYSNTLSVATLAFLFDQAQIPITPLYDVALYKVDYETISPLGGRTQASGALALPVNSGQLLPLVSYQHGTITLTNDAPSSMDLTGEVTVGIGFASTGYAAAVPDYLGLGDSPGLHPYHHANSEATACVDMLRAVRTFCATNGFALTNLLFLCGYSEGGHATMALLRELETYHADEFTVTACAPMAGAYDLSGAHPQRFPQQPPSPGPLLLPLPPGGLSEHLPIRGQPEQSAGGALQQQPAPVAKRQDRGRANQHRHAHRPDPDSPTCLAGGPPKQPPPPHPPGPRRERRLPLETGLSPADV